MPGREQIRRESTTSVSAEADAPLEHQQVSAFSQDLDAILGDIDDVLEENAEEFVRGFVQKGGE